LLLFVKNGKKNLFYKKFQTPEGTYARSNDAFPIDRDDPHMVTIENPFVEVKTINFILLNKKSKNLYVNFRLTFWMMKAVLLRVPLEWIQIWGPFRKRKILLKDPILFLSTHSRRPL
jgi:hypothetical protein